MQEVIINGIQGDHLSSLDRGLLYGDGLFETMVIKNGEIEYWNDHIARLQHGCDVLDLHGLNVSLLEKEINQICHDVTLCIVKVIITRGVGQRGYKPTQQPLTRIIQKFPWHNFPARFIHEGVDVAACSIRLSHQNKLAQIKHLNRLEQVLARSEWDDEYQEGLVFDIEDNVIEATSSNVFFSLEDILVTPDLTHCGVAGVMRKHIIEYCQSKNIILEIRPFKCSELEAIQSMLLCNSVIGVWPVRSYCGRKLVKAAIIDKLITEFNRLDLLT